MPEMRSEQHGPVIALGLDAADPELLEAWMDQGHLPHLSQLRQRGSYGRLKGAECYQAETPWTSFLTGVGPEQTGYWGEVHLSPGSYEVCDIQAYGFSDYPPFYALGEDYRVAVFDLPKARLNSQVNGPQVLAWGAHAPSTASTSLPKKLYQQIQRGFGNHPMLHQDHGDWWDENYLQGLRAGLKIGIERRSRICRNWIAQEPWDLFLTVFSETHSAGHDFWAASQAEHPLHDRSSNRFSIDPLLEIYQQLDQAIGEIVAAAPANASVVIFSLHGCGPNTSDLPAMFFLGEFLYRWCFGAAKIAAGGQPGEPVPPPRRFPWRKTWTGEIWQLKDDPNPLRGGLRRSLPSRFHPYIDRYLGPVAQEDLASPEQLRHQEKPFFWQPVSWYQPFWPQMKAFALPSFSEGYIRINLAGREPKGIVSVAEYDAVCEEITAELKALRNPRNGAPVVKRVVQTRRHGLEENSLEEHGLAEHGLEKDKHLPDADLVVLWAETSGDVVESDRIGRIGPVPFRRTGSHRPRGFMLLAGPEVAIGKELETGRPIDVSATILDLMGAAMPEYLQGQSLLQRRSPLPVDRD